MPSKQVRNSLFTGALVLAIAVVLGAFGAHALEKRLSLGSMNFFQIGLRYHYYHGFGILILGFIEHLYPSINFRVCFFSFLVGILLFSVNLYFYALSGVKTFAMIVPFGGTLFIVGWISMAVLVFRKSKAKGES